MCFSATASFTTAVALTPLGLAAQGRARRREDSARCLPLAYLAMAFALWPLWIPWSALRLCPAGPAPWRRRVIRAIAWLGRLLALLLWLPLLLDPSRITPVLRHGSIDYQAAVPGSAQLSHLLVTLIYASVIVLPLLIAPRPWLWLLALALAVAFAAAQLAYLYAFSSVWCYFSAVLSVLVLWVLAARPTPA